MRLRSIRHAKNLQGKTVLMRVDFNVPVMNERVHRAEDFRLVRTLPTILFLLEHGARVVLIAHRGRPAGTFSESLQLMPIVVRLRAILKQRGITVHRRALFDSPLTDTPELQDIFPLFTIVPGRLFMFRNIRFDPREEANNMRFARLLSAMGDIYVNDAFAVAHRKNASVHAITKYLPSYAGLLLEEEVRRLSLIWKRPRRPFVVLLGGAKISTKIGLVQKFLDHADHVLLGGGIASTFFALQGKEVGHSLIERSVRGLTRTMAGAQHDRLVLPVDVVVSNRGYRHTRVTSIDAIRPGETIVDIGPKTVRQYSAFIRQARLVLWNGPMGIIETPRFARGTMALLRVIAAAHAESIVGGGESVQVVRRLKLEEKISFISTGGGAMLEFLEKGTLPGIEPLRL